MQLKNCISNFVRRMRLELTRPCDHYPLKVACIQISPPAQGLFEKLSGKRDSNPRPQPWQGCALPTELFPQTLRDFISHLRMQSYVFFLIWPNIFVNIFICLVIVLIINVFCFEYSLKNELGIFEICWIIFFVSVFDSKNS